MALEHSKRSTVQYLAESLINHEVTIIKARQHTASGCSSIQTVAATESGPCTCLPSAAKRSGATGDCSARLHTGHNDRLLVECCFTSTEHRPQRPPVGRLLFYVHRTQATTTACWSTVVLRPQNTGHNDRLLVDCCFTSTEHRPQRPPVGRLLFYVHRTQAPTTACWSTVVLRPQNTGHNDRLLVERCFTSTEHRPQRPPVGRLLFYVHRTQAPTTACWSTVVLRPQNTGHNDRLLVERCFTST